MDELIRCADDRRLREVLTDRNFVGVPARGVRSQATDFDHVTLTAAQQLASSRAAVACDLTAAHLWELPVPAGFGLDVDAQPPAIATKRNGSRHRALGIRGRRLELPLGHVTIRDGIAVTTPARTWLDCAAVMPPPATLAMGDAILARRLDSSDGLRSMIEWRADVAELRWHESCSPGWTLESSLPASPGCGTCSWFAAFPAQT